MLSAALLTCGWVGLPGLTLLVAFVPLLFVDRHCVRWSLLTIGLWSAATTWWIGMVPGGWPGAVLSVIITIVLFGAVFWVFNKIENRARWVVLVAAWVVAEWAWMHSDLDFPWLVLGNGLAGDTWAVQWYELTGAFGGTVWVWACNILIFNVLRRQTRWFWAVGVVCVPLAFSAIRYATYNEKGEERTVAVVQPNFFAWEKFGYVDEQSQIDTMLRLSALAPPETDYFAYPETAVDMQLDENNLTTNPVVERFRGLLKEKYPEAKMIVGATTLKFYRPGEQISYTAREALGGTFYDYYNAALAIDTTQRVEVHHKTKLVVGVERMPFRGRWKFLDNLMVDLGGTSNGLGIDSIPTVFEDKTAAAICWEAIFGEYMTRFPRRGAELLIVISNDSWWGDTSGYRQLFKFSRLRAIETRRAIARSAATGISGFIDQRGDILEASKWNERAMQTATLRMNDRITFYVRWGDWVARIAVLVFALGILYSIALRFKRQ